ncbi:DUF72 domain-containing protein [Sphingomonas sp. BIUV-7]|uniref:DUF72 domain-containing protein n=1 Tax=Sphingomonas natans TaxID=3063330 RepID=A0ABT8YE22_9SPHN|nr:DUF72 domain-containing protein [Sphingomonas sp. BIUV-7]MDO6415830.1 DUF72 domain-containing protein [Sphingomonas sp. BIUV-7]
MIRLGTAGWSIPAPVGPLFPGDGPHLERYAAVMPAVEINSSFHRPHRRSTYERWARSVPADFRFSVKIPKTISHGARLLGTDALVDAFLDEVGGLGAKLEILLLQLPPSFAFEPDIVAPFLTRLRGQLADGIDIACEPRHAGWFTPAAEECLIGHLVARVAADPVRVSGAEVPGGWAGLRYHRLHGSPRIYHSSYDTQALEALAAALPADAGDRPRQWCIFDNTASGAALPDAIAFQALSSSGQNVR